MHRSASWLVALALLGASAPGRGAPARLIEWGWDLPSPQFVRDNVAAMEKRGFDGVAILFKHGTAPGNDSNFARQVFHSTPLEMDDPTLAAGVSAIQATNFKTLTHNFLDVYTSNLADDEPFIDWFDDWSTYLANVTVAGRVAKEAHLAGIILDTEQYRPGFKEFQYSSQKYQGTKTLAEYQAQVRLRGKQVMQALAAVHPDIVVLWTFANGGMTIYLKPDKTPYIDLLPAFLDGFLDALAALPASGPRPTIVDGYEHSFGFRTGAQFDGALARIKTAGRAFSAVPALYDQFLRAGFANWIDNDSRYHDCSMKMEWSASNFACNWFTPAEFQEAIHQALRHADGDSYVWVYDQVPNWWTDANLPDAYVKALQDGKAQYLAALPPEPDAGAPPAPDAAADGPSDSGPGRDAGTGGEAADAAAEGASPVDAGPALDAANDPTAVPDLAASPDLLPADLALGPDAARAASSGGCGCSLEGPAGGAPLPLVAALVLAALRRRRR